MMPTFLLPSLLPHVLLAQAAPVESAPTVLSRLQVEGGVDAYYGYDFNRPASGTSFLPGTGTTARRQLSAEFAQIGWNAHCLPLPIERQPA